MGIKDRLRDIFITPGDMQIVHFPPKNPNTDPDLIRAQREAFLTTGVISGQVVTRTDSGVSVIDFDNRNMGDPTRTFYPNEGIPAEISSLTLDTDLRTVDHLLERDKIVDLT